LTVDEFIKLIAASPRYKFLYHFTDGTNLELIKKNGLLSKAAQEAKAIKCPMPGGDTQSWFSDRVKGVFDDVSLGMTNNHPMAYVARHQLRQTNQHYLWVSPEVLRLPGVRVANGMANAKNTLIRPISTCLADLDLEVIYRKLEWSEEVRQRLNTARKYEILIPKLIPPMFILRKEEVKP
jgi:hypothetical protein